MDERERRRYQRVVLNSPGVIRLAKGPEVSTQVTEISEGGLKCVFSQAVALGISAELRFALPLVFALPSATHKECLVVGRVQQHHRDNESYLLGIEFTRVTVDVVEAIRTFVRHRLEIREPQK